MNALAAIRTRGFPVIGEPRISDAAATLQDIVISAITETLDYGVVLVDQCANVLFASAAARQFFRTNRMINSQGVLRAPSAAETTTVHQLIGQCARWPSGDGEEAVASCRVGCPQLSLQLVPVPPRSAGDRVAENALVIIFMADPARISPPGPRQLRHQFGLTAAEAILASHIVRGRTLRACAELIGISEPTARTHLHRIFEKTGTRRQAELVQLIYASRLAVRWPHAKSDSRHAASA
jgi:DNA-binding CsgD family transcriptional regulator